MCCRRSFQSTMALGELLPPLKQVRNLELHPFIETEGEFRKRLPRPPASCKACFWFESLSPHDRLHYHQTLNSSRRFNGFRPFANKVPGNSLDFVLQSQYHHGVELFPEKGDVVLQHETIGRRTFRRLRNTRDLTPERFIAIGHPLATGIRGFFF